MSLRAVIFNILVLNSQIVLPAKYSNLSAIGWWQLLNLDPHNLGEFGMSIWRKHLCVFTSSPEYRCRSPGDQFTALIKHLETTLVGRIA